MSCDPDARRDTPLAIRLKARIGRSGPLSVADYMLSCLQDPDHGYYTAQPGIGRDFVTAPEISQMFGELIGLWCAVVWQQMGQPSPVALIELGPGRGTMMRDMLRTLQAVPRFLAAAEVHLVETSAPLTARQKVALEHATTTLRWHTTLDTVPRRPSILIANEVLDALPIEQYLRTERGWARRIVGLDGNDSLQFAGTDSVEHEAAVRLNARFAGAGPAELVEVACSGALAQQLQERTRAPLAALFIDYGHVSSASGDTLQAIRLGRHEHPLTSPGEADLTAHVDFAALQQSFTAMDGVSLDGPVTQAEFLGGLGLAERASRLMAANPAKAGDIETAAQRLMAPLGMGGRFKALGIRNTAFALPGLAPHNPAP